MDEGLNTFLQTLTQNAWERNYPHRKDFKYIAKYMSGNQDTQVPIMTNSESLTHFDDYAYTKVTHALIVLRESVLGRDLFDYAFKTYSNRWMFKNPAPADFFRTMEDASCVDLDWFWRGWFFTNDHCDIALESVKWFQIDTHNPEKEKAFDKELDKEGNENISIIRNKVQIKRTTNEEFPILDDKYNTADPYAVS